MCVCVCVPLNYSTCEKNGAIEMQHNNNNNDCIIKTNSTPVRLVGYISPIVRIKQYSVLLLPLIPQFMLLSAYHVTETFMIVGHLSDDAKSNQQRRHFRTTSRRDFPRP